MASFKSITPKSILKFKITDDLSGVTSIQVYLDKEWILCHYSPKKKELIIHLSEHNLRKKSNHMLTLLVEDKKGNLTKKTVKFELH